MTRTARVQILAGAIALTPAFACGVQGPQDRGASECEPGVRSPCQGPSGCEGFMVCDAEGTGHGSCACGEGGGGTGASGTGASGTGASSTGASGTGASGTGASGTGNTGSSGAAGGAGSGGGPQGSCTGTPVECQAAQLINDYRAAHMHPGECAHPLQWNAQLGQLAHDHQQANGTSIGHSSHGHVENVGYAYGLEETVEWILAYDPGMGEGHCASDGSYVASHHCAGMFCANQTVGVGIYEGQDTGFGVPYYMTMMFGDANGDPAWSYP